MQPQRAMTEGPIARTFFAFALPLFLGNLFQQLYNAADSLIVGNLLGYNALAAVSSTGNLIFLLVGFINGLSVGAGVVIAQQYGARTYEDMSKTIHTTIALGLSVSAFLTAFGVIFAPQILILMNTPQAVLAEASTYLRIYFAGSVGLVMYNGFVGILQSVGDSKHPLYYLILSSVVNVILDIVFITVFHWGVWSAAAATVIAQVLSAVLCFIQLLRTNQPYRVHPRKIGFVRNSLKRIIRFGIPSGLQNSVVGLSNVVVQSNINVFGELAMAGCGAYQKIEGFGLLPMMSFSLALTTFVSQNVGAGEYDRARKGAKFGLICGIAMAQFVGVIIFFAAPQLIAMFNGDPQVLQFGVNQARTVGLFFFLPACSHCIAAILRGNGKPMIPLVIIMICWCVVRIAYLTITIQFIPSITVVYWAYPITWMLSTVIFIFYYRRVDRQLRATELA